MEIHEILRENAIKDYYTAKVKAEVILDMILAPVIGGMLTVIGHENQEKGIHGEMRLLAKEFPMLNKKEGKRDYRNCNADYLMCDNETVYFVELKTARNSLKTGQMDKYLAYCKSEKTFADTAGKDFINLLNHVSKTGYAHNNRHKPWGDTGKDDLKWLFETIINYPQEKGKTARPYDGWEEKDSHHADRAVFYLKNEKALSSKKYLLTAGQMLDCMGDWWGYKVKVLYLIPEILPQNRDEEKSVTFVSFQEIMGQAAAIGREMEKQNLEDYWNWVMGILTQCGLG